MGKHLEEGRRGVRPKKSGHQQGRTERAPPRIHQRMEETEVEGRGGAEAAEGETDEEEGDQGRAREKVEPGEEVGRGEVEEDRGREASRAGGAEEESDGRGREEKTGGKRWEGQGQEEMKISLSFRIKPLDLESMDSDELKGKAEELFNTILLLETEKYDCEQRRVNQDYELKELKERQKVQLRQKAAKKGLDPEAFTGKYPPRIRMFSKYERRTDTRTYADRKGLHEGGWEVVRAEMLEAQFKEKLDEWNKRTKSRLPKWFGERPGKKAGAPDTPEGEEDEAEGAVAEEVYEEEEDEEDYDEEEE